MKISKEMRKDDFEEYTIKLDRIEAQKLFMSLYDATQNREEVVLSAFADKLRDVLIEQGVM